MLAHFIAEAQSLGQARQDLGAGELAQQLLGLYNTAGETAISSGRASQPVVYPAISRILVWRSFQTTGLQHVSATCRNLDTLYEPDGCDAYRFKETTMLSFGTGCALNLKQCERRIQ